MPKGTEVTGACLCGALRFRVELPALFCVHCHCSMCRRGHGAGFVTWFAVPRDRFRIEAGAESMRRYASSDHGTRSFCERCGSSLFCESERQPDHIDIVLANMEAPIDLLPQSHAWFDHRASWVVTPDDLPRLGGQSGLEPLHEPDTEKGDLC